MPDRPIPKIDDKTLHAISCLARDLREDATQEAYLAILEGEDPHHAVRAFGRSEQRRRRREQVGLRHEPIDRHSE